MTKILFLILIILAVKALIKYLKPRPVFPENLTRVLPKIPKLPIPEPTEESPDLVYGVEREEYLAIYLKDENVEKFVLVYRLPDGEHLIEWNRKTGLVAFALGALSESIGFEGVKPARFQALTPEPPDADAIRKALVKMAVPDEHARHINNLLRSEDEKQTT